MKHPEPKDWIPYLYKEAPAEEQRRLKAHLENCPECSAQLESWQHSLRGLDEWKLPRSRPAFQFPFPAMKWAAAAVMVLAIFVAGRLSARGTDPERLRARIEPEIRQQLKQELTQLLRQELDKSAASTLAKANLHTDQVAADVTQTLYASFKQDLQGVRQDVATLAVNADVGLRRTQQQLVELADYTQPATQKH